MIRKYLLPVLAVAGFSFGMLSVAVSNRPTPIAEPVSEPADSPFQNFIAGAGIIEARSQNIAVGTPLPGIVTGVPVTVGDQVKTGDVLFKIDDREVLAELKTREADLAKARADVGEAEASLADANTQWRLIDAVTDRRAISTEELEKRRYAVLIAKAALNSARAQVEQAVANRAAVQTTLDRLTVRALDDGEILQVNVRPGEFAQAGTLSVPLILMGNLEQLHIRVDIDENDAWRFRKDSKAVAYLRGNRDYRTDLTLVWVEPYVVPKKSLTGDSSERVDTRVLQALYRFDPDTIPAYVGQQMDVFIETPNHVTALPKKAGPSS